MIPVTLLFPTWDRATTAKTFELDKDRKPILKSSYNLGKTFRYKVVKIKDIKNLYKLLDRCKNEKVVRVYGTPVSGLPSRTQRLKDNFQCDRTRVLLIDADGWPLPPDLKVTDAKSVTAIVKHMMLNVFGYSCFDGVEFCTMLSSSSWRKDTFRGHIYFTLDKPTPLSSIAAWANNHNSVHPAYKIDPAVLRDVQPDYIAKRDCVGFKDPLPDHVRLTQCDNPHECVDQAELLSLFEDTARKAGTHYVDALKETTPTNTLVSIGSSWEKTLKLCGGSQGINDPAYRGCAQLVNEVGEAVVTANLYVYVEKVYKLVWDAIKAHGIRGDQADRENYTRDKIKGYIVTALKKGFGETRDIDSKRVNEVLDLIRNGASVSLLFDRDVREALIRLRKKDPSKLADIRSVVKNDFRKVISLKDFDGLSKDEADDLDYAQKIEAVINRIQWIRGSNTGRFYCKVVKGEGYKLAPLSSVDKYIFEIALGIGIDPIPRGFEADVIKVVMARESDPMFTPFVSANVEVRSYTQLEDGKFVTFYNLGANEDGEMKTARIDCNGVKVVPSSIVPVQWITLPSTHQAEIYPIEDFLDMMGKMGEEILIERYIDQLNSFASLEDRMAVYDLAAWQAMAIINYGTANMLEIVGSPNSGKSTTAILAKELVDPSTSDPKNNPDIHNTIYKKDELAKMLSTRQVAIFDNFSNLKPAEQNTLCTIATGWSWEERILYTQERNQYRVKKPVIITALNSVVTQQDLRSRTVSLVADPDNRLNPLLDVYREWGEQCSMIRSGLFLLVSRTLRRLDKMVVERKSMNGRNLVSDAARAVLYELCEKVKEEKQLTLLVKDRVRARDVDEALLNSTTSQILIWIHSSDITYTLSKEKETFVPSSKMFRSFKDFLNDNVGNEFRIHGSKVSVEGNLAGTTHRQFGAIVGSYANDIHAATGWKIRNKRVAAGRGWVFKFDKDIYRFIQAREDKISEEDLSILMSDL